jgi:hypothetical protein
MATTVYFNAVAQPTNGTVNKTGMTGNQTSTSQNFTGQSSAGGLSEFAAWNNADPGAGVTNVIPGTVSLALHRLVDEGDPFSWMIVTTINAATSRVQQVFPNGTYRVVATGFAAETVKIVLQGV